MTEGKEGPRHFELTERATLRMAESVMSNYKDARSATLDLIDNCVDNRIEGRKLTVRVSLSKDMVVISNIGGQGLDQQGLQNFLQWGHSEKTSQQIGQYGVGGKAAMGFLGKGIEVRCSPSGSREEYRFFDADWESKGEESEKTHRGEIRSASTDEGYFRVSITGLKRTVPKRDLISQLGDIYRPLLSSGEVEMFVGTEQVKPIEIKYQEDDPALKSEQKILGTVFDDRFKIKVGVLEPGQRVKPGIRCYYRGRLVEAEQFFGHKTPAQLPQASRFIGEAHLDFLSITTNKSDFIRDARWDEAAAAINRFISPLMKKLEILAMDKTYEVEEYEDKIAKQVKRALEHILAHNPMFSRSDLKGESAFRLPPGVGQNHPPTGRTHAPGLREGATPPDLRANVGPGIKRWGILFDWKTVPMGIVEKRSDITDVEGKEELRINTDFPMYQTAKKAGRDALWLYQAETAVLEICKRVYKDSPIDVYVDKVNELVSLLGQIYYNEGLQKGSRFSSGSIKFN